MVGGRLDSRVIDDQAGPGIARTWNVDVNGLQDSSGHSCTVPISSRRFRRHAKILIFRIGDWTTEQITLNPLAASLRAQLSLLLPPDEIDVEYIRTLDELAGALLVHGGGGKRITARQASPWGYAILVGHGRAGADAAIQFGDSWHTPDEIVKRIMGLGPGRRAFGDGVFVSLCCQTGDPSFADGFSDGLNTTFVGPSESVHAFEAAGFVHRLFYEHFLNGETWKNAFSRTQAATGDFSTNFKFWEDGADRT